MTHFPEDLQKTFANRLAEEASCAHVIQTFQMLRRSGLLRAQPTQDEERPSDLKDLLDWELLPHVSGSERIGVWERKKNTSYFTRRLDRRKDWDFWADIPRIEDKSKGAKKRVLLIGESVARGYLYDPQFTPAMSLELMLQSHFGSVGIEVIDLAQLGATFRVGELALSALALKPDATIIFSGNNWRSPRFRKSDIPFAYGVVKQSGVQGIKQLFEDRLSEKVKLLIQTVGSVYEEKKIPLLWIVPEFNLGDWRDPIDSVPYLSGDANSKWIVYQEKAQVAMREQDFATASTMAKKMTELDGGVTASGLYLLAECSQIHGNLGEAREYLEAARDAAIWDASMGTLSPRSFSVSQDILRKEAMQFENAGVLDLPRFFFDYLGGALPDRRLFLDYCHMTSEGIRVSMAAAASHIIRVLGKSNVPWQALAKESPAPSREVEAEAAFCAAIHNAHHHQEYDLIYDNCATALTFSPKIAEVMVKFAEVRSRGNPTLLSAEAEELSGMPWPSISKYLFTQRANHLDKHLVDAIGNSLEAVGINASIKLKKNRKLAQGITMQPINLLDNYYSSSVGQPQENLWVLPSIFGYKQQDYYKAYSRISRFCFVAEVFNPISLKLTFRLPNLQAGVIEIRLNGKHPQIIAAESNWATWDIIVDGSAVEDGVNEVTIHWPTPTFSTEDALNVAADDIVHDWLPQFYCVFGEIHTLDARSARMACTSN